MKKYKLFIILGVLILVCLITLFVYQKFAVNSQAIDVTNENITDSEFSQEGMGDAIQQTVVSGSLEDQKKFIEIYNRMIACLGAKNISAPAQTDLKIDSFVQSLKPEFGEVDAEAMKWKSWFFKTSDGFERRIRLETIEADDGQPSQELHLYGVNSNGETSPIEIDQEEVSAPTEENALKIIGTANVFYKEYSRGYFFKDKSKLDVVEKNGFIGEFEVDLRDHTFRCQSIKSADSCACIK